jgi:hypothetical protein
MTPEEAQAQTEAAAIEAMPQPEINYDMVGIALVLAGALIVLRCWTMREGNGE